MERAAPIGPVFGLNGGDAEDQPEREQEANHSDERVGETLRHCHAGMHFRCRQMTGHASLNELPAGLIPERWYNARRLVSTSHG